MVTMNQGIKEVRESGSRFIHLMESGLLTAYGWVSGPPMTELERRQLRLAETEAIRRYSQPPL